MTSSIHAIFISLVGLLVLSLILLPPAQAVGWVGNDNGEFDRTAYSNYVAAQGSLSAGLAWTTNNNPNQVSFQYNPDYWSSETEQWGGQWFQTIISSNPNGCVQFFIQIFTWDANLVGSWPYPNTCQPVSDVLLSGASWYIEEDMPQGSIINSVYFSVIGWGSMSYTMAAPDNLHSWIRSNICWCGGANGGFDTFSAGAGSLSYWVNKGNLIAISPPSQIATTENSNMPYTQFSGSGTSLMAQKFGWPPPPPPGGGCNGCNH